MIDKNSTVKENVSKSKSIDFEPMPDPIITVSGANKRLVCIHRSTVSRILMSILSFIAILIAIGSTLSNGRTMRLRNV